MIITQLDNNNNNNWIDTHTPLVHTWNSIHMDTCTQQEFTHTHIPSCAHTFLVVYYILTHTDKHHKSSGIDNCVVTTVLSTEIILTEDDHLGLLHWLGYNFCQSGPNDLAHEFQCRERDGRPFNWLRKRIPRILLVGGGGQRRNSMCVNDAHSIYGREAWQLTLWPGGIGIAGPAGGGGAEGPRINLGAKPCLHVLLKCPPGPTLRSMSPATR